MTLQTKKYYILNYKDKDYDKYNSRIKLDKRVKEELKKRRIDFLRSFVIISILVSLLVYGAYRAHNNSHVEHQESMITVFTK